MTQRQTPAPEIPAVMRAIRLHAPGGPTRLVVEQLDTPPGAGCNGLIKLG